jgi:hypothetical protein
VVYLALAQDSLWGLDIHVMVAFLSMQQVEHPYHLLYLRLMQFWSALADPLGLPVVDVLRAASAVGTALGVAALHRAAAALGLGRGAAAAATALCATAPATVFFATVAEVHGVFFAFAGVVWWAWARLVRAPGAGRAAAFGLCTGVAASVHSTGHLLLVAALLVGLAANATAWPAPSRERMSPARAVAVVGVPAVLGHATAAVGLALALQPGSQRAPFEGQAGYFLLLFDWHSMLQRALPVLWHEWLVPFFPLSIGAALLGWRRGARGFALALHLGLAVYWVVAAVLLVGDLVERGAYFLPLAWPAALIAVRTLPAAAPWAAASLALALAATQVRLHDRPATGREYAEGLLALEGGSNAVLLCRDSAEQEPLTRYAPTVATTRLDSLMQTADRGDAAYAEFCAGFDALMANFRAAGKPLFITVAAYEDLARSDRPFFVRFLSEHLHRRYHLAEARSGKFAAWRVTARE